MVFWHPASRRQLFKFDSHIKWIINTYTSRYPLLGLKKDNELAIFTKSSNICILIHCGCLIIHPNHYFHCHQVFLQWLAEFSRSHWWRIDQENDLQPVRKYRTIFRRHFLLWEIAAIFAINRHQRANKFQFRHWIKKIQTYLICVKLKHPSRQETIHLFILFYLLFYY